MNFSTPIPMRSRAELAAYGQTPAVSSPTNATSASIRSMTGFALVRRQTTAGELTLSLRSVNHRGIDLHFHYSGDLAPLENSIRGLLKQHIARGHVELRASLARDAESVRGSYNRELLSQYISSFRQACHDFQINAQPDLNALFQMPGVLENARHSGDFDPGFEVEIMDALRSCIEELNSYREREGEELYCGIRREIQAIEERRREVAELREQLLPRLCDMLRERLGDVLRDADIPESRLIEEAALLANRSDIAEELTRLHVHSDELNRILRSGGEIGKKIDFLLQEMNRETNTMLSKTAGAGEVGLRITNLGVEMKSAIEKIRELALNLE